MTRLIIGVGCLALSCVALLFARDVWHANDAQMLRDLLPADVICPGITLEHSTRDHRFSFNAPLLSTLD